MKMKISGKCVYMLCVDVRQKESTGCIKYRLILPVADGWVHFLNCLFPCCPLEVSTAPLQKIDSDLYFFFTAKSGRTLGSAEAPNPDEQTVDVGEWSEQLNLVQTMSSVHYLYSLYL